MDNPVSLVQELNLLRQHMPVFATFVGLFLGIIFFASSLFIAAVTAWYRRELRLRDSELDRHDKHVTELRDKLDDLEARLQVALGRAEAAEKELAVTQERLQKERENVALFLGRLQERSVENRLVDR